MLQERARTRALNAALLAVAGGAIFAGPAVGAGNPPEQAPAHGARGETPPPHAAQPQAPPAQAPAHGVRGTQPRRAKAPAPVRRSGAKPPAHAPAHGVRGTQPRRGPAAAPARGGAPSKGGGASKSGGDAPKANNGGGEPKVTICHATGSATNPFVEITVAAPAVRAHDRHQHDEDIIPAPAGGCPTGEQVAVQVAADAMRVAAGEAASGQATAPSVAQATATESRARPRAVAGDDAGARGTSDGGDMAVLGAIESEDGDAGGSTGLRPLAAEEPTDGGELPFTGLELVFVVMAGLAALLGGVALRRALAERR